MKYVEYKFCEIQNFNKSNYCFQFVKNRKLSSIYHSHDFYEIIYFLNGKAEHLINNKVYNCYSNNIFILRPFDKHCFTAQSNDVILISISIQKDEFESIEKIYNNTCNSFLKLKSPFFSKNCSLLNYSLLNYEKMSNNLNEYDYKFFLSSVLHYYVQTIESKRLLPSSIYFAINEMKKPENLQIGIDAFIKLSNYSQTHLARLMKKYYNTTPKHYINELRLQNAYENIVLTQKPIELIAEQVGFSSYSHFNKIFKQRFSVTPAFLRKQKTVWTV